MDKLPHCDDLFMRFIDRWYDDDDRRQKGFPATRPDVYRIEHLFGIDESKLATRSRLAKESRDDVFHRIETIYQAARKDWATYLKVSGEFDSDWIDAFDNYYDEDQIAAVIQRSDPESYGNDYLVLCCEFGAALGHSLKQIEPRLLWRAEWPYWESDLVDPVSGNVIPVFHWAFKKMNNYGWDDGFVAKIHLCLSVLNQ